MDTGLISFGVIIEFIFSINFFILQGHFSLPSSVSELPGVPVSIRFYASSHSPSRMKTREIRNTKIIQTVFVVCLIFKSKGKLEYPKDSITSVFHFYYQSTPMIIA